MSHRILIPRLCNAFAKKRPNAARSNRLRCAQPISLRAEPFPSPEQYDIVLL